MGVVVLLWSNSALLGRCCAGCGCYWCYGMVFGCIIDVWHRCVADYDMHCAVVVIPYFIYDMLLWFQSLKCAGYGAIISGESYKIKHSLFEFEYTNKSNLILKQLM